LRLVVAGARRARQAQPRERADDSLGQEQGHDHEPAAEHEQPELRRGAVK
jgi:hypothetical protein